MNETMLISILIAIIQTASAFAALLLLFGWPKMGNDYEIYILLAKMSIPVFLLFYLHLKVSESVNNT
jgi:hypothetical protein